MAKANKKNDPPKISRYQALKKEAETAKKLYGLVHTIGYKTVLYRDVMFSAMEGLAKAGRLEEKIGQVLDIQIKTIEAVMLSCLGIPKERAEEYRVVRSAEDFKAQVTGMMEAVAPTIIRPDTPAPGTVLGPDGKEISH